MSAQRPVRIEITRISGRVGEVSLLYLHHKLHSSSSVDRIKRDGSNCGRADAIQKTQKYNSFLVTHMRTLTSFSAAEDEREPTEADATETDCPCQTGTARASEAPGRGQG
jgi:hypothetical protein